MPAPKKKTAAKPAATIANRNSTTRAKPAASAKAVKSAAPAEATRTSAVKITPEERQQMVEREAYFIAERNGFQGNPHDFWVKAEAAISARYPVSGNGKKSH